MSAWLAPLLGLGMLMVSTDDAHGDIDLAKRQAPLDAWAGATVGEVLAEDQVARVILLKALTSATADLDVRNLRRLLREAAGLRFSEGEPGRPWPHPGASAIWEAVLVARDGRVFSLIVEQDRACLRDQDGRAGCFAHPPRRPG